MAPRAVSPPTGRPPLRLGRVVAVIVVLYGAALVFVGARAAVLFNTALRSSAQAQVELEHQDLAAAHAAVVAARQRFAQATAILGNPVVRVAGGVPLLGANLRTARRLSAAGVELAAGGEVLLGDAERGLGALAPRGHTFAVASLAGAGDATEQAARHMDAARALVSGQPPSRLLGPVATARDDLLQILGQSQRTVAAAEAMVDALPALLGAEGPRRYLLAVANPAELRGSGGLLGAYAIATMDDGEMSVSDFAPANQLPNLPPGAAPSASPGFAARYGPYGSAGAWLNANMTPHFPWAAAVMENLYHRAEGHRLDGSIVVTPDALRRLLQVTGPVRVAGVGTVNAEKIVAMIAMEAYGEAAGATARTRRFGIVAGRIIEQFLDRGGDTPVAAAAALAGAADAGDLLLHAVDAEVQAALETAGVAGALQHSGGDLLAVTANNTGANNVDVYAERSVAYDVAPRLDGWATATATLELTNHAPTRGAPRHVIGPNPQVGTAGDSVTLVSAYCAPGCLRYTAQRDGETMPVLEQREAGLPVFTSTVALHSGESTALRYGWTVPDVWQPATNGGTYRFTFHDQATIRPTRLTLRVAIPEGLQVAHTSHDMTIRNGRATWTGEPSASEAFEIEFRRPLTGVLRSRVRDFWRRPLFG